MSPRKIDPLRRAKAFAGEPSPRLAQVSVRSHLARLDRSVGMASALAVQPPSTSIVEVVHALPEPTGEPGRDILVLLPGETITSRYVLIMLPDGTLSWQLMGVGQEIEGGGTSGDFTFLGNMGASSSAYDGIWSAPPTDYIVGSSIGAIWRVNTSTGVLSVAFAGIGNATSIVKDGSGNYYLAQPGSNRIRKYDSAGALLVTTPTSKAYIALYMRPGTTTLYACSASDNQWFKITNLGTLALANTISTSISAPRGICEDSLGNIYVANAGNNTIRKYNSALTFQTAWGSAGSGDGQFSTPKQMWVDSSDRIYVADSGNNRIQVFNTSGTFLGKFGSSGSGSGQLSNPSGLSMSGNNIEVADTGNNRISRWIRS